LSRAGEVRRYMREFLTSWQHVRHVAEEFVENGERVLVVARQEGVGKHSGAATEHPMFAVWTFRGDEVIRLEHFRDRGPAVAAAGLHD
jgi:ketosteroid isomerase-like protein